MASLAAPAAAPAPAAAVDLRHAGAGIDRTAHCGAHGAADQRRGQQRCDRPGQQAVRGVAEIDFIGMDAGPLGAQAARHVAAHRRRGQLGERNPQDGRDADCRRAVVRPGRDRGKAEARTKNEQHQRQRSGSGGARKNRAPRHAGALGLGGLGADAAGVDFGTTD